MTRFAVCVLSAVLALCGQAAAQRVVSMGKLEVRAGKGASTEVRLGTSGALEAGTVDFEGTVVNETGMPAAFLTVRVEKSGTVAGDDLPCIAGISIGGVRVRVPKGTGQVFTVVLGQYGMPPRISYGDAALLLIDLAPAPDPAPRTPELCVLRIELSMTSPVTMHRIAMGTIAVVGGTVASPPFQFDHSVGLAEGSEDLVGAIHNALYGSSYGIHLRIAKSGESVQEGAGEDVPIIAGLTIDGISAVLPADQGQGVFVPLGVSDGPPAFQTNAILPFTIDLAPSWSDTPHYAGSYEIRVTMYGKSSPESLRMAPPGVHIVEGVSLQNSETSATVSLQQIEVARVIIPLSFRPGAQETAGTVQSLKVEIRAADASTRSIQNLYLANSQDARPLAKLAPQRQSPSYTLHGLRIARHESVVLSIQFADVPKGPTSILIFAQFAKS